MRARMRLMEEDWWEEKTNEIQAMEDKGDGHSQYDSIRTLAKEKPFRGIRSRTLPRNEGLELNEIPKHFKYLLNISRTIDKDVLA